VTTFVDSTLKEIDDRLRELSDEVSRLEAARAALVGNGRALSGGAGRGRPRRSTAGDSTGTASSEHHGRGPGRPRGRRAGTRATQALELVQKQPGITIPDLAKEMRIEPNYLYRVMPKLESDGQVRRDGQGWHRIS